jgi:hypothetical protein
MLTVALPENDYGSRFWKNAIQILVKNMDPEN